MSWWKWCGIPARIFHKLDDVSDTGQLIFGSANDHRYPTGIYEMNVTDNDYLYDIAYRWPSHYLDMDKPHALKRFHFVNADFDNYNGGITLTWWVDNGLKTGSLVMNVPVDRGHSYGSLDDVTAVYNDSTGTTVNGGFYTSRKAYSLTFRLPQECRGRVFKYQFSAEASGNAPMEALKVVIGFEELKQLYPSGAR
jgi:hypothetical protein